MLFKARRNEYADTEGPVRYLDGSGLSRPILLPRARLLALAGFVAAAALIGGFLLFKVLVDMDGNLSHSHASMEENLARDVSYDLPSLTALAPLDDAGIRQSLADAGISVMDTPGAAADQAEGLKLVKLPSDVSEVEAGALYLKGVSKLSAADAALLLKGMWTLEVSRGSSFSMRLRYADFSSGSVDAALNAAMASEGLDPATISENGTGIDEAGNTFRTGTVDVGQQSYTWRVSGIALSSAVKVSGLPSDAVYVGVRLSS